MDTLKVNDRLWLHLGSGAVDFGKFWIHIDAIHYNHVQYNDVSRLPFLDGHAEKIYASHVLEYFDQEEGLKVLKEWARVVRGTLYIAVPDFEAIAKLYVSGKWPIEDFIGPLYGKIGASSVQTHTRLGVFTSPGSPAIYHKTVYDERSLCKALHKAGFTSIRKRHDEEYWPCSTDQSNAYLPDRNRNGTLISLNLIATK
jgi:SAM-dependent methyltransferase